MSKPALSLFVFGLYLVGMGTGFVAMPNVVLGLFGLPATSEVWIRVVGLLALLLAFYYIQSARTDLRPMIEWSVPARIAAFLFFVLFVVAGWGSPILILFGAVDLLAALWTAWTLRVEKRRAVAVAR